jgi:phosphoglucosamine mutase
LTSLLLASICAREQKSLGELSKNVEIFPQVNKNVRVKNKAQALNSTALWDKVRLLEKSLNGGRILIRASGTEPLIRILVEGKSLPLCEEIAQSLGKIIESTNNG